MRGLGFITLPIVLGLIAWLTVRAMRVEHSVPTNLATQLKENGIEVPANEPVTSEKAVQAVQSTLEKYEKNDLMKKERALDDAGQ